VSYQFLFPEFDTAHRSRFSFLQFDSNLKKHTERRKRESQQQQEESREFMKSQNQLHHLWFTPSFAKLFLK
jgi:hypothetical protein